MHRLTLILAAFATLGASLLRASVSDGGLKMDVITAYNFVVDSNVESPSSVSPQAAHLGVRITNTSSLPLTNVVVSLGEYDTGTSSGVAGSFPLTVIAPGPRSYAGTFSLQAVGGSSYPGAAEALCTRTIVSLAPGESTVQYFFVTYPLKDGSGKSVTGAASVTSDDLALNYDFWATASEAALTRKVYERKTVTMRNEISAMANKIEPNTTAAVPPKYLDAISASLGWRPGSGSSRVPGAVVSEGIWYNLGNVGAGFDNDGDAIPDRNAWLQPAGLPGGLNPLAARLVKCYGLVIVKLNDGSERLIPFEDQLYFEKLPANNTGAVGLVWYEYATLTPGVAVNPAPYQEVASGYDNEKFNGDFGAGSGAFTTPAPGFNLTKTATPTQAAEGDVVQFSISAANTSGDFVGQPSLGLPLVIEDSIPAGLQYDAGSATLGGSPAFGAVIVEYSTDGGVSWSSTEPAPAFVINRLRWTLVGSIPPSGTWTVGFGATLPAPAPAPSYQNVATASLGNIGQLASATTTVDVVGLNSIGDLVWNDLNRDGIKDPGEAPIANLTVILYQDVNGDGILDGGDLYIDEVATGAAGDYLFKNLNDGKYIVQLDGSDGDIPAGLSPAESVILGIATDLDNARSLSSPVEVTTADFPMVQALAITKTASAPSYSIGDLVSFTIDLENLGAPVPPSGLPEQTAWTSSVAAARSGNVQLEANAQGAPNSTYARIDFLSAADTLTTNAPYSALPPGGSITKVEVALQGYLGDTLVDDELEIYANGVLIRTFSVAELNAMLSIPTLSLIDVTADYATIHPADPMGSWSIAAINNLILEVRAAKKTAPDGKTFWVDAFGVRVTSSASGSPTGTPGELSIVTLPLRDVYDATKLSYVSASVTPDSVTEGVLLWNDLGVLHPGGRQTLTVTFRALAPTGLTPTQNLASSSGARFSSGLAVNNASDTEFVGISPAGSIGNFIWWDTDADGLFDVGESGLPNVQVNLSNGASTRTDANGAYLFSGLADGAYTVTVATGTLPFLPASVTTTADPDAIKDGVASVSLNNSNSDPEDDNADTIDFGFRSAGNGVTGQLYADINGDGDRDSGEGLLAGITVTVFDALGSVAVATVTTDANGFYAFGGLADGTYTVRVMSPPPTTVQTVDPDSTLNGETPVVLAGGVYLTKRDFAYQPRGTIKLGDKLYVDYNGNGTQDAGDEGIANVGLSLYADVDGDGRVDPGEDALVATTSTDADGTYGFSSLPAGNYILFVDGSDPEFPLSVVATEDPDGRGDNRAAIALAADNLLADFGYQPIGTGVIGDAVYADLDGNGSFGLSDQAIAGITVRLYEDNNGSGNINAGDALVASVATDVNGVYTFSGLAAGRYLVELATSWPPIPSDALGNEFIATTANPKLVTLAAAQSDLTADFPYVAPASIGDVVYYDNNGNGTRDAGELGISGVSVSLMLESAPTIVVASTTTDANGAYQFSGLQAGTYRVVVNGLSLTNSADPDRDGAPSSAGGPPPADGVDENIRLAVGVAYRGADFGYIPASNIGDLVWIDIDRDGALDAGERGIPGVRLTLRDNTAVLPNVDLVTDGDGRWSYANIPNGSWTLEVDPSSLPLGLGLVASYDADGVGTANSVVFSSIEGSIVLAAGNLALDFGYAPNGTLVISGEVFTADQNTSATPDEDELSVAGAQVYLFASSPTPYLLAVATTGVNGSYSFPNLAPGPYQVILDATTPRLTDAELTTSNLKKSTAVSSVAGGPGSAVSQSVSLLASSPDDVDFAFLELAMDFGDLPEDPAGSNYKMTSIDNDGARHLIPGGGSTIFLGAVAPDAELNGVGSATANVDDDAVAPALDDEDGVVASNFSAWKEGTVADGLGGYLAVTVGGTRPSGGWLVGWIDWDNDGDFNSPGEMVLNQAVSVGLSELRFDIPSTVTVTNASSWLSRFRILTDEPAYAEFAFTGSAVDGEVEDYVIKGIPAGEIIGSVKADTDNNSTGDSALAGITLSLLRNDAAPGTPVSYAGVNVTTTTDATGAYRFEILAPGNYRVVRGAVAPVSVPTRNSGTISLGYRNLVPSSALSSDATKAELTGIAVTAGGTTEAAFVLEQDGFVAGKVRLDTNRDNVADADWTTSADEPARSPLRLTLYEFPYSPSTSTPLFTTLTDSLTGYYEFPPVPPGDYVVIETEADGTLAFNDTDKFVSVGDADGGNPDLINQIGVDAGLGNSFNDFVEEVMSITVEVTKVGTVNVGPNGRADAGDTVTYVFSVNNTGNVPLTNVVVTELNQYVNLSGAPIALLPAETVDNTTYSATYTLTQADIDAGTFVNTASVRGEYVPRCIYAEDATMDTQSLAASGELALVKTGVINYGPDGRLNVGDSIEYSFTVTNNRNVTLTNVTINDLGADVVGTPIPVLLPGASNSVNYRAVHVLTSPDLATSAYVNSATASASALVGPAVVSAPASFSQPLGRLSIRGRVFYDTNQNNVINASGPSADNQVANALVELWQDLNNSGSIDAGDRKVAEAYNRAHLLAGENPGYLFEDLAAGTFLIRQMVVGASAETDADAGNPNQITVSLPATGPSASPVNQDFLVDGVGLYTVSGRVTDDDHTPNPMPNVKVEFFNGLGVKLGETTTNNRGDYSFGFVTNGTGYQVRETNPTIGITGDRDVDDSPEVSPNLITFDVAGANVTGRNFQDLTDDSTINTYCLTTVGVDPSVGLGGGTWTIERITGARHGRIRQKPGSNVLTYVPGKEFYGQISDSFLVTLSGVASDGSRVTVTRTVVVRSFQSVSGTYEAMLDASPDSLSNGKVSVALTRDATISGTIALRNRVIRIAGPLNGNLSFDRVSIKPTSGTGTTNLRLTYSTVSGAFNFSFVDGSTTYTAFLPRVNRDTSALAGIHSLVLRDSTKVLGYATLKVGKTGGVTAAGEMAWGGTFTASGGISTNENVLSLFKPFSGKASRRMVLGIETALGESYGGSANGASWIYQDSRVSGGVQQGPINLDVLTSRYIKPLKNAVIFSPYGAALGFGLSFVDGSTPGTTNLDASSTASSGIQKAGSFQIKLDSASGRWSGSVLRSGVKLPVRGVWMQPFNAVMGIGAPTTGNGYSWILGSALSGSSGVGG